MFKKLLSLALSAALAVGSVGASEAQLYSNSGPSLQPGGALQGGGTAGNIPTIITTPYYGLGDSGATVKTTGGPFSCVGNNTSISAVLADINCIQPAAPWTPTDGSTDAITFTSAWGSYAIVGGNQCLIDLSITYPNTTGKLAHAIVAGVPAACGYVGSNHLKTVLCFNNNGQAIQAVLGWDAATKISFFILASGNRINNVDISTSIITCQLSYVVG